MKIVTENGWIIAFGEGIEGTPVPEETARAVERAAAARPAAPAGWEYRLRADTLTWDLAELSAAPDPAPGAAEALDYLFGGDDA